MLTTQLRCDICGKTRRLDVPEPGSWIGLVRVCVTPEGEFENDLIVHCCSWNCVDRYHIYVLPTLRHGTNWPSPLDTDRPLRPRPNDIRLPEGNDARVDNSP